jgi:hypothetical protein
LAQTTLYRTQQSGKFHVRVRQFVLVLLQRESALQSELVGVVAAAVDVEEEGSSPFAPEAAQRALEEEYVLP